MSRDPHVSGCSCNMNGSDSRQPDGEMRYGSLRAQREWPQKGQWSSEFFVKASGPGRKHLPAGLTKRIDMEPLLR